MASVLTTVVHALLVLWLRLSVVLVAGPTMAWAGWIDPDTPAHAQQTTSLYEEELLELARKAQTKGKHAGALPTPRRLSLVFSDEFDVDGRTFRDGEDPRWTALHRNDYTNFALHHYSHDADVASTVGGLLNLSTIVQDRSFDLRHVQTPRTAAGARLTGVTKNYKSAMLQGE